MAPWLVAIVGLFLHICAVQSISTGGVTVAEVRKTLVRNDKQLEDNLDDDGADAALASEIGEEQEESTEYHQVQLEKAGERQEAEAAREVRGASHTDEDSAAELDADQDAEPMPDDEEEADEEDVDTSDGSSAPTAALVDEGDSSDADADIMPGDIHGQLVDAWQARALLQAASKVVDSHAQQQIQKIYSEAAAAHPSDSEARRHRVGEHLNNFAESLLQTSWVPLGIDKDQIVPTILDIHSMAMRDRDLRSHGEDILSSLLQG